MRVTGLAALARGAADHDDRAVSPLRERPAQLAHERERAERVGAEDLLQDLLRGVKDRVVVAVTFLAMLELMKRREIVVVQDEPWGPIMARRTTREERAAAGVTDTIDEEAPLDESLEGFA